MAIPSHYSLLKEHPASFEIHNAKDNTSFHIAKQHLDAGGYAKIQKMQKFDLGGEVASNSIADGIAAAGTKNNGGQGNADLRRYGGSSHYNGGVIQKFKSGGVAAEDIPGDAPAPDDTSPKYHAALAKEKDNKGAGLTGTSPEDRALTDVEADQAAVVASDPANAGQFTPAQQAIANLRAPNPTASQSAAPTTPADSDQVAGAPPSDSSVGITNASYQPGAPAEESSSQPPSQPKTARAPAVQAPVQPTGPVPGSVEDYQAQIQKNLDDLNSANGEHAKLIEALQNNKIDPNKYWENHSKVSAALGIILGGYAQGLMHSPTNQAMAVVQDGINRELSAQEKNNANQMDLLKINGDDKLKTANMLATMAQVTIQKQAQQTNSEQAKLQGQLLIQQIQQMKNQNAIRGTALKYLNDPKTQNGDQTGPINNTKWQAKFQAGLMTPEENTEATKEATKYTNLKQQQGSLINSFDELGKEHAYMKLPEALGYKPVAEINFNNSIAPFVHDLDGKPSEVLMKQAEQFRPSPLDPPGRVAAKREGLINWANAQAATPTLTRLGLLNENTSNNSMLAGPQIKTMNGIQYKKVAGGWARLAPVSATASR